MKSALVDDLEDAESNSTFDLITGINSSGINEVTLTLGSSNEALQIPVVTNGSNPKSMPITLTPSVVSLVNDNGFWLTVTYSYDHPRNNRTRTRTISCVRSRVPTY